MTAAASADTYDQACAWYADTITLRAHEVQEYAPTAWAIRTPVWPGSYAHNALVLTADPGAELALRWADEGLHGLAHRQLTAICRLSDATLSGLRTAGYEIQPEVLMARPGAAPAIAAPAVAVEQLDPYAAELQALQDRLWREEWLRDAPDDMVADLLERRSELDRAGAAVSFAVRADGDPVACLDVTVRDGVAELDGLATLTAYRGRGYGLALMARGAAYATAAGASLIVLTALTEDWPRHWYARLGFATLGPATEATLAPVPP